MALTPSGTNAGIWEKSQWMGWAGQGSKLISFLWLNFFKSPSDDLQVVLTIMSCPTCRKLIYCLINLLPLIIQYPKQWTTSLHPMASRSLISSTVMDIHLDWTHDSALFQITLQYWMKDTVLMDLLELWLIQVLADERSSRAAC